ncbi:MAG: phenylalanine--tRNA ligase beta subunit-related protein [Patescibacteria group bacterium]
MQFSYKWLQEYFEKDLPNIKDLAELLTFHAFEIEGVEGDLIDIDVLPNRSHDCFCYQGMAREIAVLTNLALGALSNSLSAPSIGIATGIKTADFISLSVDDSNKCPRAMKRFVQNIKIGPSPDWLKEKLKSIGQKSINNIVDITNFVMWETGQPVHCFDYDKLAGIGKKNISIRFAKNGEKIIALDGKEFELDETMQVIADDEKALDIAGIKGGAVSGIDENTKNVILSVCNFNQVNIRKTSKKLGLRTDASVRFENGISPDKVGEAMERLSQLVFQLAGGKVAEDIAEVYSRKANLYKVGVSAREVNKLLGSNFLDNEIAEIFGRLGFEFEKIKPLDKILALAETFAGVPYKYGASVSYDAPRFFDCSSFTAYLFAQAGIAIPRISIDQYFWGDEVGENDLRAGDLVFVKHSLDNSEEKSFRRISDGKMVKQKVIHTKSQLGERITQGVDHLGLYLGDGKIIFASGVDFAGKVVIENLNKSESFETIIGRRRYSNNQNRFVVTIPHERLDLRIKEDLIEEIGRIYGYKNIQPVLLNFDFVGGQVSEQPSGQKKFFEPKINKTFYYINKIKNILTEAGFDEIYSYTFGDKGIVETQKPFASNLGFLRADLASGLQKSLELNTKNSPLLGLEEIKIFEIGKVFSSLDDEYTSLAVGVSTNKKKKKEIIENDILTVVLKKLFKELNVEIVLPNGGIFEINLDELIKKLPDLEPIVEQSDLYGDVLKTDLNAEIIFKKISPYPFALRDIAVFASAQDDDKKVLDIIKENAGDLLVRADLFDTYTPEGGNKISYAFNLVFQSQHKTLTDEEVNEAMNNITRSIESTGWEVR